MQMPANQNNKRRSERGFTLLEAVIVMGIGALSMSMYFGTHYVVQKEYSNLTSAMLTRQEAQNSLLNLRRNLSEVTDFEFDAAIDPDAITIYQDFNYPRTPESTTDDTKGERIYDPDTRTISIVDSIDAPVYRVVAKNVNTFTLSVNGNMATFEIEVQPLALGTPSTLRMAFALRNLPH